MPALKEIEESLEESNQKPNEKKEECRVERNKLNPVKIIAAKSDIQKARRPSIPAKDLNNLAMMFRNKAIGKKSFDEGDGNMNFSPLKQQKDVKLK